MEHPLIENWSVTLDNRLTGRIQGHPNQEGFKTNRQITTPIVFWNIDEGLVRTESRWYRLGKRRSH